MHFQGTNAEQNSATRDAVRKLRIFGCKGCDFDPWSNRYDPLVPWTAANQLGRDWCAQGADVEFRTNEEPPFLNKLIINRHALKNALLPVVTLIGIEFAFLIGGLVVT